MEDDDEAPTPRHDSRKADDYLPAIIDELVYELEPFIPIDKNSSEEETTVSDLAVLNNHLAIVSSGVMHARSIQSIVSLSNAACKLIETRRKVKQLPFGKEPGTKGRVFEVLE